MRRRGRGVFIGGSELLQPQGLGIAGSVPYAKDFDDPAGFVHVVTDQIGMAQHFAHSRPLPNGLPNKGILTELQGTTEQFVADAGGGRGSGLSRQVIDDLLEVGDEEVAQDDLVVHCAINSRA